MNSVTVSVAPSSSLLWDSVNELHNNDLGKDVGGVSSLADGSQGTSAEWEILQPVAQKPQHFLLALLLY